MKKQLLLLVSLAGFTLATAQTVYSVSGKEGSGIDFKSFDTVEGTPILSPESETSDAFSPYIASLAVDKNSNSLVYIPMREAKVYVYSLADKQLSSFDASHAVMVSMCDEQTHFSRMTSAADGKIYTLSNAGNDLIQVDVKNKQVKNLGQIAFPSNEKLSTYGGDLIADVKGNLFVIAVDGSVYKFSPTDKSALLLGKIKNLPEGQTVNGAAVMANGEVLISNAQGKDLYTFNLDELTAKIYKKAHAPSYDLASANLLGENNLNRQAVSSSISVYPTVVENKTLYIKQNLTSDASYTLKVVDLYANEVASKNLQTRADEGQAVSLQGLRPGVYLVKIINAEGIEVKVERISIIR